MKFFIKNTAGMEFPNGVKFIICSGQVVSAYLVLDRIYIQKQCILANFREKN